jgi:purine-nucleoside phosphorylase
LNQQAYRSALRAKLLEEVAELDRETTSAIDAAKQDNIACVEMEAAGLYAYAAARNRVVVCFAHITNTMATEGDPDFEKRVDDGAPDALAVARAAADALR